MANATIKKCAAALSALGAAKGGTARAAKLSPARRAEIAREASLARWGTAPVRATHGAPDRPLCIGEIEIPCYVLEDGRRVLTQRGLQSGIGLSEGGGKGGARRLVGLMGYLTKKCIDTKELEARANSPIRFVMPHGGTADGYEARILPDICAVLIEAGRVGKLQVQQAHLAHQAALLQHGFATVGINALVDEATGFKDVRDRDALAAILEKFVAKELRPWVRTFPPGFYKEMYRLHQWSYSEDSNARPGVVGRYTTDLIYERLAPGIRGEILRTIPRGTAGKPLARMHQMLTEDLGHPKLKEHIAAVTALMRACEEWGEFIRMVDRALPKFKPIPLLPSVIEPLQLMA